MNPKIAKKAEAVEFGRALMDFGLNILVSDVATTVLFLEQVLQMKNHRSNRNFRRFGVPSNLFSIACRPHLSFQPPTLTAATGRKL